jgi:hypothetical protein
MNVDSPGGNALGDLVRDRSGTVVRSIVGRLPGTKDLLGIGATK